MENAVFGDGAFRLNCVIEGEDGSEVNPGPVFIHMRGGKLETAE